MEARIARLESDVSHLCADVGDIKVDVRALRDKIDGVGSQLNGKVDGVALQLNTKIDNVSDQLNTKINNASDQLNTKIDGVKDSIVSAKFWALTLYIALATVMLGTMARGFGWI